MARFYSLGESLCAFIKRLFSWILYHTLDSCNIIFLYESSCVFAFSDQCWMLCHKLDIFCIILESCSPLSSLAVGILCIFFPQRLHLKRIILHVILLGFFPIWAVNALVFTCWTLLFSVVLSVGSIFTLSVLSFSARLFVRINLAGFFFFFLTSYFSASFSSVLKYHFFNCFLNLFGFFALSSSGMMW